MLKLITTKTSVLLALTLGIGCVLLLWRKTVLLTDNDAYATAIALDWNKFLLLAETDTEGFRGPVAGRAYGYLGLAAYEAALPGLPASYRSLGGMFPGLYLPTTETEAGFSPAVALNACYASLFRQLFVTAPRNVHRERQRLAGQWEKTLRRHVDPTIFQRSQTFGEQVAHAVFSWSATDTLGHLGQLHNYDRSYVPPRGEGRWTTSPEFPMPPLLPYWGGVRPFLIHTPEYLARPLPPHSSGPRSPYYAQALEVLTLSSPLSSENQWIAEFWHDDHPGLTFTPAGHWLAITNQVVELEQPPLEKTLETYLKTGFALADALIACWYSKYHYNLERPETFIRRELAVDWRPLAPSPPFPSYPSGHAMMGAAAAEVLRQLYGDAYELTDRSLENRREFKFPARHFHSFTEMARENALSRILLGVHYRMDCEEGLRLGMLVGRQVSRIELDREAALAPEAALSARSEE